MKLSETQKKYLRGLGHDLKPLIIIGDAGLTESVMAEFESTLAYHELIKIKIRTGDRSVRDTVIDQLCTGASAELVQRIGNVALLYRVNHDKIKNKRIKFPLNQGNR